MLLGVRADVARQVREGQGRTPGQHSVALVLVVALEILASLLDPLVQTVRH